MEKDLLPQSDINTNKPNSGYWTNYRKHFFHVYKGTLWKVLKENFECGVFCFTFLGIVSGVIAILIGGLTYGLGTVTLASSISLGLFGGLSINAFPESLLFNITAKIHTIEFKKCCKRRLIATLILGSVFAIATILIGVLTFGIGVVPLGTFVAAALTTAFGSITLTNFAIALCYNLQIKKLKENQLKSEKKSGNNLINENETSIEQKVGQTKGKAQNQGKKPPNLEGQQKGKDETNFFDKE